jgi:hypothetical protein
LDLAVLLASTSTVVAFDVDAFPISPRWLQGVVDQVRA